MVLTRTLRATTLEEYEVALQHRTRVIRIKVSCLSNSYKQCNPLLQKPRGQCPGVSNFRSIHQKYPRKLQRLHNHCKPKNNTKLPNSIKKAHTKTKAPELTQTNTNKLLPTNPALTPNIKLLNHRRQLLFLQTLSQLSRYPSQIRQLYPPLPIRIKKIKRP